MFEIEYRGGNTVIITSKKAKIVIDPKLSLNGLKDVVLTDAIEIATEPRFAVNGPDAKLIIEGPGEYGVADFDIRGVAAQRHLDTDSQPQLGTMYRIEIGDSRIGVIGNIYEKLSDDQLEEMGILDILILPIGGNGYTLDAIGAASVVRKIDPKVVIPIHYADKSIRYEVPQSGLEEFTKELGSPVEQAVKYKVKSNASIPSTLTIVELTRT